MFTFRALVLGVIGFSTSVAIAQQRPNLGEPLSAEEVEAINFVVTPDGEGLPSGSGSVSEGAEVYAQHCLACHGEEGEAGINDRLAGGHGTMRSEAPVKTLGSFWPYATTVFDYVRRAMPYQDPGSLSDDEVYALTAYLLFINDIVEDDATLDADTLPEVAMPNKENFVWAYTPKLRAESP